MMTDPPTDNGLDSTEAVVTVPGHLARASSKILIYLAQVLEIPDDAKDYETEEMTFTAEEMETLEPIDEDCESRAPSMIDGVCVNSSPRAREIENIIDARRVGTDRQTFYLAKSVKGYYWFHTPRSTREPRLRELVGAYRRTSRTRTRGITKLRSGRMIGM
jgi:hypothetical protein